VFRDLPAEEELIEGKRSSKLNRSKQSLLALFGSVIKCIRVSHTEKFTE